MGGEGGGESPLADLRFPVAGFTVSSLGISLTSFKNVFVRVFASEFVSVTQRKEKEKCRGKKGEIESERCSKGHVHSLLYL